MFAMPFGRFKGTPLAEIGDDYLAWLASKLDDWRDPLRSAIVAEVERRRQAQPAEPVAIDAEAVIAAGSRALRQRHTGDVEAIRQIQRAATRLRGLLAPSKASALDAPVEGLPF
jgi:putative quorum-sensing-regulated virulence factor